MAPATASDVGRLASDFVFIQPELSAVVSARKIALKAGWLVRQNFALALLYNCCAIPLAVAGQITPLFAAIAMSSSSIVVIANSMRLNFLKPAHCGLANGSGTQCEPEGQTAQLAHRARELPA